MGVDNRAAVLHPIDPLAPLENGCYRDDVVTVVPRIGCLPWLGQQVVRTAHFELWRQQQRLVVRHRVPDARIDDGLTTLINDELFVPGWVAGSTIFESLFTGVVLTSRPSALDAWSLFYENSFRRFDALRKRDPYRIPGRCSVADFAFIHQHADALVPQSGSVLEIGSCFGFLSLFLARLPHRSVIASDICPGTVRLLGAVAQRLGVPVRAVVADAARIPLPTRSVDVVLLVHLLEHLDHRHGRAAIVEAMRVATRRVVIAVPFEEVPTAAYGHVRTVSAADLLDWGRGADGWTFSVHEYLGGWLVLDRRPSM